MSKKPILTKISLILYATSLFLPAFSYLGQASNEDGYLAGGFCLLEGWFMLVHVGSCWFMLGHFAFFAWLANIPYLALLCEWCFPSNGRSANALRLALSATAFFLSTTALFIRRLPLNEGGATAAVVLEWGGYAWIGALSVQFGGALIQYFSRISVKERADR